MRKILLVLAMLLLIVLAGYGKNQQHLAEIDIEYRDFKVGITPFPRNFPGSTQDDWQDVLDKIPEVAEVVNAADGTWRPLTKKGFDKSLIGFVGSSKDKYGYTPIFGINYCDASQLHQKGTIQIDWSSAKDREAYKKLALDICKIYGAEYLALAIENNFHYKYRPQDYDIWVEAYKEIYDQIKQEYPNTKVFVTFQYEMTKGLGRRYWGDYPSQWEIIEKFGDKLDLVVFTSYPEIEYDSIDQMPEDYYSEIAQHTEKKVAFTELGWQNGDGRFIAKFLDMTKDLDLDFVMWIFMHDTKLIENNPFPGVGLREYDGTPKGAWYAWKELKQIPYKE